MRREWFAQLPVPARPATFIPSRIRFTPTRLSTSRFRSRKPFRLSSRWTRSESPNPVEALPASTSAEIDWIQAIVVTFDTPWQRVMFGLYLLPKVVALSVELICTALSAFVRSALMHEPAPDLYEDHYDEIVIAFLSRKETE